jgi:hypothetical protein
MPNVMVSPYGRSTSPKKLAVRVKAARNGGKIGGKKKGAQLSKKKELITSKTAITPLSSP